MRVQPFAVALALVFACSTSPARAQLFDVPTAAQPPGGSLDARFLAMGGASVAANDARGASSAAPASFSFVTAPQAAVTLSSYESDYYSLENVGNVFFDDVITSTSKDVSAITVAAPFRGFTLFSRYEEGPSIRSHRDFYPDGVGAATAACPSEFCVTAVAYGKTAFDRRTRNIAAGGAWRNDTLAVGATIRRTSLHEAIEVSRLQYVASDQSHASSDRYRQRVDDHKLGWDASLRLQVARNVAVAVAHNSATYFDVTAARCSTTALHETCASAFEVVQQGRVGLASRTSVGATWTPHPRLVLAADVVQVAHRDTERDRPNVFGVPVGLRLRDVRQPHVGAEYATGGSTPVALRLGWWKDPNRSAAPRQFRPSPDEEHLTAGIGIRLARTAVDLAYDESRLNRTAVVSISQQF